MKQMFGSSKRNYTMYIRKSYINKVNKLLKICCAIVYIVLQIKQVVTCTNHLY